MDDEKIYNAILDELREHGPRQGLWAKCFTEANGDENAAKALYFKYRAQQLVNQESSATVKSKSTDLAKHVVPSEQIDSHSSQNNTVVLLLVALAFAFIIGFWLLSLEEKQDVIAVPVNPSTSNSSEISVPNSTKQEVEKSVSQSAFTETNQSSTNTANLNLKVNEFEIAGKAIEKELATKLHLFKYKLMDSGKVSHYSKNEINFYPLDFKYSQYVQENTSLFAHKEFVGDPSKNQPSIIVYSIEGYTGNASPVEYCFRSQELDAPKFISCFIGLDPRQNSKIKLKNHLIELTYRGYAKNDSYAGPSIPILKVFEYINGEMVCTGGNCEFKDFQ